MIMWLPGSCFYTVSRKPQEKAWQKSKSNTWMWCPLKTHCFQVQGKTLSQRVTEEGVQCHLASTCTRTGEQMGTHGHVEVHTIHTRRPTYPSLTLNNKAGIVWVGRGGGECLCPLLSSPLLYFLSFSWVLERFYIRNKNTNRHNFQKYVYCYLTHVASNLPLSWENLVAIRVKISARGVLTRVCFKTFPSSKEKPIPSAVTLCFPLAFLAVSKH